MECSIKTERCGGLCTGYDGSHIWKQRRQLVKKIECETCRDEADKLETFTHDIVNARLGKPVYDKQNFHKFVEVVNCAANTCKKEGRC